MSIDDDTDLKAIRNGSWCLILRTMLCSHITFRVVVFSLITQMWHLRSQKSYVMWTVQSQLLSWGLKDEEEKQNHWRHTKKTWKVFRSPLRCLRYFYNNIWTNMSQEQHPHCAESTENYNLICVSYFSLSPLYWIQFSVCAAWASTELPARLCFTGALAPWSVVWLKLNCFGWLWFLSLP